MVDHAKAIDLVYHKAKNRETFTIGGFNEWKNIDLVNLLCKLMDKKMNREQHSSQKLITYVKDRPGHDFRYAIDSNKINRELGGDQLLPFRKDYQKQLIGILKTIHAKKCYVRRVYELLQ